MDSAQMIRVDNSNSWLYIGAWHDSWFSASSGSCCQCDESSASTCCWHGNVYQPAVCHCARWCHWTKTSTDVTVQSSGFNAFF